MANEKGPANSAGKFKYEGVSPRAEEEILSFWRENKIFEKSLGSRKKGKTFVFFEGPPYANGLPGIHHVESRSFKDIILRYKTMRGFFVPRRAGWDTHGLPTEMAVEKILGIKSKREIEEKIGVEKFVEEAKKNIFTYIGAWEKLTERMAYWLDFKNAYVTMKNNYIESLWSIVSKISEKKLLYEDYRVLPWCTRCGTSLSSHELAQGYKKVKEESIYVKFPIKNKDGGKKTSFLVWTTTPWTLGGNVALAVNPKIDYATVETESGEWLILAESRLSVLEGRREVINKISGEKLIGMEYEPLYPAKAPYKVVGAPFVSTEDGSGIVHIAPAFGGEDMNVGKKEKLPTLITVDEEGKMFSPGKPWEGIFIKSANPLIIEDLKGRGLLYKTEMYEHDYPHCWRCETPLMYYARSSWFFKTTAVKERMLAENAKIDWHPEYLKDGRFGEWLKENVDWGISRERYWGTPLPVWRCGECKKEKVIGSLDELDKFDPNPTEIIFMRHGEARHNVEKIAALGPDEDEKDSLTEMGKKTAAASSLELKKEKVDVIVSSPALRARETAGIVAEVIGMNKEKIEVIPELYDIYVGGFAGKLLADYKKAFANIEERFTKKLLGAETLSELRARVMKGLDEIKRKHGGKRILVVSHGDAMRVAMNAFEGGDIEDFEKLPELNPAQHKKISLHNWPYNTEGELDLHKPYIDSIHLRCDPPAGGCGGLMSRVKEVIDVWFDSGSMPFASQGYPQKIQFYPADYIAEAIDQTRGWFYTLLAVSSLLGIESSYKRVLSLGLVLDEKGNKMSKSKGNVVDPKMLMKKYGADAVRWYFYTANQPWDDKLFREKDIQDSSRRFLMILWNSFMYWRTYKVAKSLSLLSDLATKSPKLIINKWILAKWSSVLKEVTENLEKYDIVSGARKLENFVTEDLSRWYIRRIREHMKHEKSKAARESSATLGFILLELSKTLAPFTPFISEGIYKEMGGKKESVHLEDWPSINAKIKNQNVKLIDQMDKVREIVSRGLEARQAAGIKIRQPLEKLQITNNKLQKELLELIKGEVNVKDIIFGKEFELDTKISEELKEEGLVREFIRQVQDFRKELKLTPQEKVELSVSASASLEKILKTHESTVKKEINISKFSIGKLGKGRNKEIMLEDSKAEISINHVHHLKIES